MLNVFLRQQKEVFKPLLSSCFTMILLFTLQTLTPLHLLAQIEDKPRWQPPYEEDNNGFPVFPLEIEVEPSELEAREYRAQNGYSMPYRLWIPRPIRQGASAKEKFPLFLFLHGGGERGSDNIKQLSGQKAPLILLNSDIQERWPHFFVAPQSPLGESFYQDSASKLSGPHNSWALDTAVEIVKELMDEFKDVIDQEQIYVGGMSMGGVGSWNAISLNPKLFRKAMIICGFKQLGSQEAPIKEGVKIWNFHSVDDPTVPIWQGDKAVDHYWRLSGELWYTRYPEKYHLKHFSWQAAFADPDLAAWLFGRPQKSLAGEPLPPEDLSVIKIAKNRIILKWKNDPTNTIDHYIIESTTDGMLWYWVGTADSVTNRLEVDILEDDMRYRLRLHAVGRDGQRSVSSIIDIENII